MAKISQNDLARYIVIRLKDGKNLADLKMQVANYLVATRRSRDLSAIMRKVISLRQLEENIVEAKVTSAYALSPNTTAAIKSLLGEPSKVVLSEKIDPAVIGGVRIEGADRGIDLTVEYQLKQLKQLSGANL